MDKMNRNCIEGIFEYRYRIHGTYAGQHYSLSSFSNSLHHIFKPTDDLTVTHRA